MRAMVTEVALFVFIVTLLHMLIGGKFHESVNIWHYYIRMHHRKKVLTDEKFLDASREKRT